MTEEPREGRVSTRQLGRVQVERWLYRTSDGDYGPMLTDQLLEAIAAKKVDLRSQVRQLGNEQWTIAGEHQLFRNFYEKCRPRWAADEAERERAAREEGFIKRERSRKASIKIAFAVALVLMGAVGWWIYKVNSRQGLGLAHAARVRTVPSLPVTVVVAAESSALPIVKERTFAVLAEPETPVSYDTAGVRVANGDQQTVTRLDFNDDGEVQEIDPGVLASVLDSAKRGVYACAQQFASQNASFSGTEVGFAVASGHLARITVGAEVRRSPSFQACVKAALGRVPVPSFGGSERYVTLPIRIAH